MKWFTKGGKLGGSHFHLFDFLLLLALGFLAWYFTVMKPHLSVAPARAQLAVPVRTSRSFYKTLPLPKTVVVRDIQLVVRGMTDDAIDRIKVGDKDTRHPDTIAEIIEIRRTDAMAARQGPDVNRPLETGPTSPVPVKVRLSIRSPIRSDGSVGPGRYLFYKNSPVLSGRIYHFFGPGYQLTGRIAHVDDIESGDDLPIRRLLKIRAFSKPVEATVARKVQAGESALSTTKSRRLGTRLKVKQVFRNVFLLDGHPSIGDFVDVEPEWRLLEVMLECFCTLDERGYHYGSDSALRAGESYIMKTGTYKLALTIKKIEMATSPTQKTE
jgi:hypothetical protein